MTGTLSATRRAALAAAALASLAALATAGAAQDDRRDRRDRDRDRDDRRDARVERLGERDSVFTWRERVAEGAWLRVMSFSGPVEVRAASGSTAEVRAEKRTRGDAEDIAFEVRRYGDDVTICAVYRDSTECGEDGISTRGTTRNAGVHFVVMVPRGVRLKAASGNGDVSVQGATADVVASSGNGVVEVSGSAGPVRASSGNGEVTVEGATAGVTAHSGNGRIRVSTAEGPVSASSGNGDIFVRMSTLRGDGDMDFRTGNGLVRVTLPADFEGELETAQGQGTLRTDFPLTVAGRMSTTHIRATIGHGGRHIRLASGNGDLELRKPGGGER